MPSPAAPLSPRLRWDLYCRVIDNFGDLGVSWRLARQLAAAGDSVRLVVDDPAPLAWMAPAHERTEPRVQVQRWPGAPGAAQAAPADVVIEAFGCDPPEAALQAMRAAPPPGPVWINLEYLSAEDYVERSHGLRSPRPDGLRKWFFYPGFTARTGGLLREPGLMAARASFDRAAWLAELGLRLAPGERVVSLFCYDNPHLPALLQALAAEPTLLLATPGAATHQVQALAAAGSLPPALRVQPLPWLAQPAFDALLWAADLNAVRGEDSLVRALWAGAPFLWQIYPQHDLAQAPKLEAFMARLALPDAVRRLQRAWNGLAPWEAAAGLPAAGPWRAAVKAACVPLLAQDDLASRLRAFVIAQGAGARAVG